MIAEQLSKWFINKISHTRELSKYYPIGFNVYDGIAPTNAPIPFVRFDFEAFKPVSVGLATGKVHVYECGVNFYCVGQTAQQVRDIAHTIFKTFEGIKSCDVGGNLCEDFFSTTAPVENFFPDAVNAPIFATSQTFKFFYNT